MSLAATRWAWAQQLAPSAKLVLLALADCVHSRGQDAVCWPSVARLTRMTGLGRRTVYKALDTLEAAGLIARLPGRRGRATVYRLYLASGQGSAMAEPAPAAHEAPPQPAAPAADRSPGTARQRSGGAPKRAERRRGSLTPEQQERFERFWSIYPRRVAKGDARKAWAQIDPDDALTERICAAVQAARGSEQWRKEGGRYIPYPATWLRREGWEDEQQPQLPADQGRDADERVQGTMAAVQRLFGEQGGEQS